jgi:tetratricopeptide (TPR) repeat protein
MVVRAMICVFVIVVCCGLSWEPPRLQAEEKKTWVGKKVMPIKEDLELRIVDKNDQWRVIGTVKDTFITVQKEDGHWIKVRSVGVLGWIDKADVVLFEDAIDYWTRQIKANPQDARYYVMRAVVWQEKDDLDLAMKDLDQAIALQPQDANIWMERGSTWDLKKEYEKAINDYNEAIRLDPKNPLAYENRGITWNNKKEYDKAIKDMNEAIRLAPENGSPICNRGVVWRDKKEFAKAFADFEKAVRLEPKTDWILDNYAWLLATCSEDKVRDGKKALEVAKEVCELTDWQKPGILLTLAAACAETGEFKEAVKWQKKALDTGELSKDKEAEARKRLKLYENGKPYRMED